MKIVRCAYASDLHLAELWRLYSELGEECTVPNLVILHPLFTACMLMHQPKIGSGFCGYC